MNQGSVKVIFDTNVWISFLIGKRLSHIQNYISDGRITVVISDQLLNEIIQVTSRDKLKKYFPKASVDELINLLEAIGRKVDIKPTHFVSRDPKDDFLFDLIDGSEADFLDTGDKDLLDHNPFNSAQIITPLDFERKLQLLFN